MESEGGVESKAGREDSDRQEPTRDDSDRQDSRQYDSKAGQEDYNSEPAQSRYSTNDRDAKESGKKASRKSAKKEGLEAVVNSLTKEESEGRKAKDGAVAAIYYVDEETGKIEFYLEEKRSDYPNREARNKFSFPGGEIEEGESDLVALIREIKEEFGTKEAQNSIIQSLLEGGEPYRTLVDYVNGQEVQTHIWKIKVKSAERWKTIKNAQLVGDAGPGYVLTHDEIWSKSDNSFAFGYGPVLKKIISKEIDELTKKASPYKNLYSTNNYTTPIITTNQKHLQTIEDITNRSLISMDTSIPNLTLNYQNKTQTFKNLYILNKKL